MTLQKAKLTPLDNSNNPVKERAVEVHFNPQSLRLSRQTTSTTGAQSSDAQSSQQTAALHVTGYSASLSVELLFDTTQTGEDVLNTTLKIAEMVAGRRQEANTDATRVQFQWGTFIYNGAIRSMDETIDLFSEEGKPLRSTVSLSLAEVQLERRQPPGSSGSTGTGGVGLGAGAAAGFSASAGLSASASIGGGFSAGASAGASFNLGAAVGVTPLTLAQSGDSLQSLSARAGVDWKAVASANNIDNPRLLDAGAVVNLNVGAKARLG